MKQAVIDIGSNSMRLSVYETNGDQFKILFREKIMAGLAGYVEKGILSEEGIACAYNGLLSFRETLESLSITAVSVFATASLRNISNTDEAVAAIAAATGFQIEVVGGDEEALYGYAGAMRDLNMNTGIFVDIGGASTEIAAFSDGCLSDAASFPVGSLKLYRECVKKILPGKHSQERLTAAIEREIPRKPCDAKDESALIACVGGTARAVLKIAKHLYTMPDQTRHVTAKQLNTIADLLCKDKCAAADLILKLEPERIHTLVPGTMILRHIVNLYGAGEIIISKYGVREGYLCQKILARS